LLQRQELVNFFKYFLKKDDLVFDVGANMGGFVDAFLQLGTRVFAIEPNPFCVKELQSLYGNNRQFTLINCALGAIESEEKMYLGGQGMHNVSTLSEEWKSGAEADPGLNIAKWDKHVMVTVKTLDQLIKEYGVPKFCKVDVEGFELEVLRGLSQPIPVFSLEYTPWRIDPTISCIEHLTHLGPYTFNITMNKSREGIGELEFRDWIAKDKMIDLINKVIRDTDTVGDLYAKLITEY